MFKLSLPSSTFFLSNHCTILFLYCVCNMQTSTSSYTRGNTTEKPSLHPEVDTLGFVVVNGRYPTVCRFEKYDTAKYDGGWNTSQCREACSAFYIDGSEVVFMKSPKSECLCVVGDGDSWTDNLVFEFN